MAKIKLEFDLNLPEDKSQYQDHYDGPRLRVILQDFDNYLKSRLKYLPLDQATHKELSAARDYLTNNRTE